MNNLTFNSRFYGETTKNMSVALAEANKVLEASGKAALKQFSVEIAGKIVVHVDIGPNHANVYPINWDHRPTVPVSDWDKVAAVLNLTTDDMLGEVIATASGFHVNAVDLPYVENWAGVICAACTDTWAHDNVLGFDRMLALTGNPIEDNARKFAYYGVSFNAGQYKVGTRLTYTQRPTGVLKDVWASDHRQESMTNGVIDRQIMLDMLMSGKALHLIWPDYRSNYAYAKYLQFLMDADALRADKAARLAAKRARAALTVGHSMLADAQSAASESEALTGIPVKAEMPAAVVPVTTCKLMDEKGNVSTVDISTLVGKTMDRYMNGQKLRRTVTLGDDLASMTLFRVEAKQGMIFKIFIQ